MRAVSPMSWDVFAADAPDGLAIVDSEGCFTRVNHTGCRLLGLDETRLLGTSAPFALAEHVTVEPAGLFDGGASERVATWAPRSGTRRELAYRTRCAAGDAGLTVVTFRDVTDERHRQRRIAAVARSAAILASQCSLPATLDALAGEVLKTDALAGVQIMTLDESGQHLRVMGSAGFRHWPDFFDRLIECRERGATLHMLDALRDGEPVVIAHRRQADRADPAWAPLHAYLGELRWDAFASVPLITRGRTVGVLNAFFAPGQAVGTRALEFLLAMAEQAAIAIDYAALMQHERDVARRQERRRLARDLHDSLVQQVFSISMQANALELLAGRGDAPPAAAVRGVAHEVGLLAQTALADLRTMVHELRPSSVAESGGLGEALHALVESTAHRTGLRVSLALGRGLDSVRDEMAEDVYRILAEAVHNVVKHAEASRVTIRLSVREDELRASVRDDGRGLRAPGDGTADRASGYGLTTMRERAQRWGGTVTVTSRGTAGTAVRLVAPLSDGVAV